MDELMQQKGGLHRENVIRASGDLNCVLYDYVQWYCMVNIDLCLNV